MALKLNKIFCFSTKLLEVSLLFVLLMACGMKTTSKEKGSSSPTLKTVANEHAYVLYEDCSTVPNCSLKISKDGVSSALLDGSSDEFNSSANLKVSGSDVYVVASVDAGVIGTYQIRLWKNGVSTNITDQSKNAVVSGVVVSGSDVYVYGSEEDGGGVERARYWKNGVATTLTDGTGGNARIDHMQIVNGKKYCLGVENKTMKLWINGAVNLITDGVRQASTKGIEIVGSDVYIFGSDNGAGTEAKVWKNGVVQSSTSGIYWYGSSSSNGDIYAVAIDNSTFGSAIWMNGLFVDLITAPASASDPVVVANAVRAFGDNLYIAGWRHDSAGDEIASYWKDGVESVVTTATNTHALDIAISK